MCRTASLPILLLMSPIHCHGPVVEFVKAYGFFFTAFQNHILKFGFCNLIAGQAGFAVKKAYHLEMVEGKAISMLFAFFAETIRCGFKLGNAPAAVRIFKLQNNYRHVFLILAFADENTLSLLLAGGQGFFSPQGVQIDTDNLIIPLFGYAELSPLLTVG